MRILQTHNFYQQPGGEDIVVSSEEKLLTRKGHQVFQYSLHNDSIAASSKLQVAQKTLWNGDAYRTVRRKIQKYGIEIVHSHNTFPLLSPAIYYAAQAEKIPVVQTLHNYRLLCPAATFFRDGAPCEQCLGKLLPLPAIVHRCYRGRLLESTVASLMLAGHSAAGTYASKVNKYIALSHFSLEKFVQGGLPRARMAMKPNFVLEDPGIGSGYGGYALYAGRLATEKGLLTLLKAWSQLGLRIKLKIAGDGPLRPDVESLAQTDPRLEYLGYCTRPHVAELMRNAVLLLFPSQWYECSPLSVMEAMACGTPVLASNLGSVAEMIAPQQNGELFSTSDSDGPIKALSSALQNIFAQPDLLAGMRYSTRQYYEKHFAAGPNYESLLRIYESVFTDKSEDKAG